MPEFDVNGRPLHYDDLPGDGSPVLLIAGAGSPGRVWHLHQVPALTARGHRVTTFDLRDGGLDSLVTDALALIAHLDLAPCQIVGFSLGARVAQEIMVRSPGVADRAVLMATRGRADTWTRSMLLAEQALHEVAAELPARYTAVVRAMQNLSPSTLNDERAVRDWLELFELTGGQATPGWQGQVTPEELLVDRLPAYASIEVPCLVIGFGDDICTPPHLAREVAAVIRGASFRLVPGCGHYGYLERPDLVNNLITGFLTDDLTAPRVSARP